MRGAEAVLEVGGGGEEHIPTLRLVRTYLVGWSLEEGREGEGDLPCP